MREQIGTVRITRARVYQLDPWADPTPTTASVLVEPGEYPVYRDGLSHYWRMTGTLNRQVSRVGDGMFAFAVDPGTQTLCDEPSDDDVVFYSLRLGPDEWQELLDGFAGDTDPALVFTLTAKAEEVPDEPASCP